MVLFLYYFLLLVESNVIGIDPGSDLIKVSVIKPGKKLVIVENEQSKRSTPMAFSLSDQGRLFGIKASSELIKRPESSLNVIKQVLGKSFDDPYVSSLLTESYNIFEVEASAFSGIRYNLQQNKTFEVEEVMGMVLEHIKEMTDTFTAAGIKDCAISIPASFSRSQKLSLMSAVQLSGLNLLGLIHDNSAAALYFALDRQDSDTDYVIVIYNIGSSYIQVSAIDYWGYMKDGKYISHVEVLGHEFQEGFAGNFINYEMAEQILADFIEKHSMDPRTNARAMARLLKEVNLAKKTLSANKSVVVRVENILKGVDLVYEFQRDYLDQIIEKYREQITSPLRVLLNRLGLSLKDINSFEIIGGVSKIPKVQDLLESTAGARFSTHIDPNEAIAHGAALYAAKDSITVTVKPLLLTDVYTCLTSVSQRSQQTLVFDKSSKLASRRTITVDLEEGETIGLENQCGGDRNLFYQYTFDKYGEITLDFVLDKNGLPFLSKAYTSDKDPVKYHTTDVSVVSAPSESNLQSMKEKINSYKSHEKQLKLLAEKKNSLESLIYYLKDKLGDETFRYITTPEELGTYEAYLEELQTWVDSEGFAEASMEDVRDRMDKIRETMLEALDREQEFTLREHLVEEARKYFKKLTDFMQSVAETATWIPKDDVDAAWAVLNDGVKWFDDKVEQQSQLKPWEKPVLISKEFDEKFKFVRNHLEKLAYSKPPKGKNPATEERSNP